MTKILPTDHRSSLPGVARTVASGVEGGELVLDEPLQDRARPGHSQKRRLDAEADDEGDHPTDLRACVELGLELAVTARAELDRQSWIWRLSAGHVPLSPRRSSYVGRAEPTG